MKFPRWFLLFDGSSADGMGPGQYAGRTDDPDVARAHHEKIRANPYSTGYVEVVEDDRIFYVHGCDRWVLTDCRRV